MDAYRQLNEQDAAQLAEAALARAFDQTVVLSAVQPLTAGSRRNLVLRAIASIGETAVSIIIKTTCSSDYAPNTPEAFSNSGLIKEWTARELLKRCVGHQSSALLAGDVEHGLIVFEDLGSSLISLDVPLLNSRTDEAETALIEYARSLGRLHAATIGCASQHAAILREKFPHASIPPSPGSDWLSEPIPAVDGLTLPQEEVEFIRSRLAHPNQWQALVHGDSCPDNVLLKNGKACLLDFEFSSPGHILLDAVYWHIGFPTCWCAGTVPEDFVARLDAAYRREVENVLPEIADDRLFLSEMAIIHVARTLFSLRWLLENALIEDTTWGLATRRSRILWYLESAIVACGKAGVLPGTSSVMTTWLARLRQRWPDSTTLVAYPAFSAGFS